MIALHLDVLTWTNAGGVIVIPLLVVAFLALLAFSRGQR